MKHRTGLLAKKIGMSRIFLTDGKQVPVTLLSTLDCRVVGQKNFEKDGYTAVCLGIGQKKTKRVSKSQQGYYGPLKVIPPAFVKEFRVDPAMLIDVGVYLSTTHFIKGQFIDATAVSIGRGFAGVMKRHNFSGLPASHGVSLAHRSQGSMGQCQDPGRIFKGKKMAGQMGRRQVTLQNLKIYDVDKERSLLYVQGSLPGSEGHYVILKDAVKKDQKDLPFPGAFKEPPKIEREGRFLDEEKIKTLGKNKTEESNIGVRDTGTSKSKAYHEEANKPHEESSHHKVSKGSHPDVNAKKSDISEEGQDKKETFDLKNKPSSQAKDDTQ